MTPIEQLIAANFTETNKRLDDLYQELTRMNELVKKLIDQYAK